MGGSWDGSHDTGSQTDESYQVERLRIEPMHDAFVCPLTKKIIHDPVTLETGQTFEREAIENWFKECRESRRRLICPVTQKELRTMDLNLSIALRNTIEQWMARNEAAQLDMAYSFLNSESDVMQALKYIQYLCQKSGHNRYAVGNKSLIPIIVEMLKSTSHRIRCKTLETLGIAVEEDSDLKIITAAGDIVRTIVKLLSHEQTKEREEAVSLLYELSKSGALSKKVGSAEKNMENLESCENNFRQMVENGRLQPLLWQLLEGSPRDEVVYDRLPRRACHKQRREIPRRQICGPFTHWFNEGQ